MKAKVNCQDPWRKYGCKTRQVLLGLFRTYLKIRKPDISWQESLTRNEHLINWKSCLTKPFRINFFETVNCIAGVINMLQKNTILMYKQISRSLSQFWPSATGSYSTYYPTGGIGLSKGQFHHSYHGRCWNFKGCKGGLSYGFNGSVTAAAGNQTNWGLAQRYSQAD